jgi:hypothetical protein
MTPSERKSAAKSKPMPSAPSKRRPMPEAAPQHMSEPAGPFKKAKGGKVMAKPGSKMPPMFAKKRPRRKPTGMKRMMSGGSCK